MKTLFTEEEYNNTKSTNKLPCECLQCKKSFCYCGLCAPKAKNLDSFNKIMEKYQL